MKQKRRIPTTHVPPVPEDEIPAGQALRRLALEHDVHPVTLRKAFRGFPVAFTAGERAARAVEQWRAAQRVGASSG